MIYEAIFQDTEVGSMNRQAIIQKFICFALGIIMVIAGAYFADVQAEAVGRLEQSPVLVSLMSPELARSNQDTAEELSGLRQACEFLEEARRYLQRNGIAVCLIVLAVICFLVNFHYMEKKRRFCILCNVGGRSQIIRYIHQQDGRKH